MYVLCPTMPHSISEKLGYPASLSWTDSVKKYGRLLSGRGADGDTVAEHELKSRDNGWTSLAQGEGVRRRQDLAFLVFISLFNPGC